MGALLSKHPGGGTLQYPKAERARGEDASQTPEPGGPWAAQTLQHPRGPPSTLRTWGVTCFQTVHFGVRGLEGSERNRPVPSTSVKTTLRISNHTCAVHHHDDSTSGPSRHRRSHWSLSVTSSCDCGPRKAPSPRGPGQEPVPCFSSCMGAAGPAWGPAAPPGGTGTKGGAGRG